VPGPLVTKGGVARTLSGVAMVDAGDGAPCCC